MVVRLNAKDFAAGRRALAAKSTARPVRINPDIEDLIPLARLQKSIQELSGYRANGNNSDRLSGMCRQFAKAKLDYEKRHGRAPNLSRLD